MWNHMVVKQKQVGFGLTAEEAEQDWYINRCRETLEDDTEKRYTDRRKELGAWIPSIGILHISGVGCLIYKEGQISENRYGHKVRLFRKGYSIYTYMSELFGDRLSYEDIAVCIQDEVSMFFRGISEEFHPLREYPVVKVAERNAQFNPDVVYTLNNGILVGDSGNVIGMKVIGDEQYHLLEIDSMENKYDALMYLCYRLGVSFEEGGLGIGESDKEL